MASWAHGGGFSSTPACASKGSDRPGLERLLRHCALPAFALEALREIDAEHLVYESVKPGPGGSVSLMLTPLELIERLAALIPPPRRHRHRYYGGAGTERVAAGAGHCARRRARQYAGGSRDRVNRRDRCARRHAKPGVRGGQRKHRGSGGDHRRAARYAWALLLARIYGVFPLVCPTLRRDANHCLHH
ncbi:MAG: transposase [Candidatus Accumulibacter sp.]|nr:transposase [Accumulibacter sp.]